MESRIFLIGFMGTGKTTMGSRLARKIGYEFVDMDQIIEETARMTIPEIFSEHGEEIFRKWEHNILQELCQRENVVIATGGGAPCHGEMMSIMNNNGITVYINLSPPALKDRLMKSKTKRPLISGKSEQELLEFIKSKLEEREVFYMQATFIIDGINLSSDQLAEHLKES